MVSVAQQVKQAKLRGVPLVAIETPDPEATIVAVCEAVNGKSAKLAWDVVRGLVPRNPEGAALKAALGDDTTVQNPNELLQKAAGFPAGSVLFVVNAHRFLADPTYVQGIWNLRDEYKSDGRLIVLLAPSFQLPAELAGDVVVFDEPLPTEAEIEVVLREVHDAVKVESPKDLGKSVEAVLGVTKFQAEQVASLCIQEDGLDVEALWARKIKQIAQTPGIKASKGGEKFSGIGGVPVVKKFLSRVLAGRDKPNAIVFIDEIEKMIGGAKGDTSGVAQDQLGTLLKYMQDNSVVGCIFVGHPGAAKSVVAKAAGNEAGIPTIELDLGAAKGSLVGQSEQQLRTALKMVTAISNGKSLWIATCNSISELPPELRRRFTLATFFFDLPDAEEREAIWKIYRAKYDLGNDVIDDKDWTGAEIRQCADIAWRLNCPLSEAAEFVVPLARSAGERIENLRKLADGRFLSASKPGVYRRDEPKVAEKEFVKPRARKRDMTLK